MDFGYRSNNGSIGDRVWNDADGDGVQDSSENGINGATVQLLNSGGSVIDTDTTSGDGNYLFTNLVAGTYTVRVIAPTGFDQTFDLDGTLNNQHTLTLNAGQSRTNVDFGYRSNNGSIGDRVWNDADGDGVQDSSESGINGTTVQLLNSGGSVIDTDTTSGNGNYLFTNLVAGTYTVRVIAPSGFEQTFDLDGTLNNQHTLTLNAGQSRTNVDFGYRSNNGSIGDRVWNDADGDGVQDSSESGINGTTVQLLNSGGSVIDTDTTSGNGNYLFTNLVAGTYTVRVIAPSGFDQTFDLDGTLNNQHTLTLSAGQSRTNVDFGYRSNNGSIGDRVWNDADGDGVQDSSESGINGTTVQLLNSGGSVIDTDTTSGNGNYLFTNLVAGTYTVRVIAPSGFDQTFDLDGTLNNQHTLTLSAGQSRTNVDFGYRSNNGSIGDRVWNDADGDGVQDSSESGINGTTVQLLNSGGSVIDTDTTSGDGNYLFTNLVAGTYTVRVIAPTGFEQTFDLDGTLNNQHTLTLSAGQSRTNVDFGYRSNNGSIGDRVWNDADGDGVQDSSESGINGAAVQLLNSGGSVIDTDVTSGNGIYGFTNLVAGTYTVRVIAPTGFAQTFDLDGTLNNQHTLTLSAGQSRTNVDFGYRPNGSIGDRVWNDTDGDGVQDSGESGINGATVQLLNSGGSVIDTDTTSGDGNYGFTNLVAGTYTVRVLPPSGFDQTFDLDGTLNNQHTLTLSAGQSRTNVDFGYRSNNGSIGDRVWNDADGDGVQDNGESGINGTTVQAAEQRQCRDRYGHDVG